MQDAKGIYYHPFPQNKRVRMYVKREDGQYWFRMHNADDDKLWEEHGWVPWGALQKAMAMDDRENKAFDPKKAYDIEVAKMLVKEAGQ